MPLVSKQDVMNLLRARVAEAGGQKQFAAATGISRQMLNDTLRGRIALGATIGASVRAVPVEMWSLPDTAPAARVTVPPAREPVLPEPLEPLELEPEPEPEAAKPAEPDPETCGACANFNDGHCHARDLMTTAETPLCPLFELPV